MTPDAFVSVGTRLDLTLTFWIGAVLLLVGVAFLAFGIPAKRRKRYAYDDGEARIFVGIVASVFGLFPLIVWLIMLVPYQSQYHRIYRVETTVLSVSNVLTEASGDLTRQPVVELEGVDRPVVIDDPRIVNLDGADVTLTCRISWHYQAADTYSCDLYSIDEDGAA